MKKILSLVLAVLLLVLATCLVGCGVETPTTTTGDSSNTQTPAIKDQMVAELLSEIGEVSETFEGSVSEPIFYTPQAAAKGYIIQEVVGEKNAEITEILVINSKGELSNSEAKAAGIPNSFLANADSVEEMEVAYTVHEAMAESGVTLLKDMVDNEKTVKVYVIKYGTNWAYYTPRPITGDTISKSYYNSVFNSEQYKNCTLKSTQIIHTDSKYSGLGEKGSQVGETKTEQVMKYADNKIYMEITTTSYDSDIESLNPKVQKIYVYMEDVEGSLSCYIKSDDSSEWMKASLSTIGFTKIEQLTPFYDQYLDYTYFTKTEYGFALSSENMKSYMDQTLGGQFSALLDQGMEFDMIAKYVVCNGVLSALISNAEIAYSVEQAGMTVSVKYTIKSEVTCSGYGTTVVEKPFAE